MHLQDFSLRQLQTEDIDTVCQLLTENDLLMDDASQWNHENFLVGESNGKLIAVGGMEIYGAVGLIRSLAVKSSKRSLGIASLTQQALEALALEKGVNTFYLLTNTAEHYFVKHGYQKIKRSSAPPAIQHSRQFSVLCPDSATFMAKSIAVSVTK